MPDICWNIQFCRGMGMVATTYNKIVCTRAKVFLPQPLAFHHLFLEKGLFSYCSIKIRSIWLVRSDVVISSRRLPRWMISGYNIRISFPAVLSEDVCRPSFNSLESTSYTVIGIDAHHLSVPEGLAPREISLFNQGI
jgi:hypothetical protein